MSLFIPSFDVSCVRAFREVRCLCVRPLMWALMVCLFASSSVLAQLDPDPGSSQNDAPSSTTTSDVFGGVPGLSADANSMDSEDPSKGLATGNIESLPPLSAEQIIGILQQNPDLNDELKSEVANRMQDQGSSIDPGSITDQMLYRQIESSASLRASISGVLRSRGFVPDTLPSAAASPSDGSSANAPLGAANSHFGQESGSAEGLSRGNVSNTAANPERRADAASTDDQAAGGSGHGHPRDSVNASTDLPRVVHDTPPYDLQALRDLYAQLPEDKRPLKRFGSEVFVQRSLSAAGSGTTGNETPLDVPLGPDYVVGVGDRLTIELWGGMTQSFIRTIDRDGRVLLPDAGAIQVAGLTLGKAQNLIEDNLRRQYRGAQVAVTVSGLRSVRVYVVGDVQRPGGYDVSSLATPLNILYAAGGPTAAGSLRTVLHYRDKQLLERVDLYDFLLHGIRKEALPFQSGDTFMVPPAGPLVAVSGAVKRPAIYELKEGDSTLAAVLDDAGGLIPSASLAHIQVERIDAHQQRETVAVKDDAQAANAFRLQDGDRVRVEAILPYSQRAVYLAGHVTRPGRVPFGDGMRLSDVLRSYRDMLPEPADRGEIVRLVAPDLHPETIEFNVPDVLIGNDNATLQPFDTIRIFGRYEEDAPTVSIRGEVLRPGRYPMSRGMSAAQLVRMAGGFRRDALRESADLTSYKVEDGHQILESLTTVRIGVAVAGTEPQADVALKAGDILSIHQITNWNEIGESVTLRGQVQYPGNYGFCDGERLSSVLRRAGGILPTAYPVGAIFTRVQVREMEQTSRDELIREIETNSAAARLSPVVAAGSNGGSTLQLIKEQQDQVLRDLKTHPPNGRMVIHISADIDSWANTPADIELRRGDVLTIPKRPGFVLVIGQVYNATALSFTPGKTAEWYLARAGGTNATANRKEIFVIRANGSVVGRRSGRWFGDNVLSVKLEPGDVVVVPRKIIGGSLFWKNLLATGQLAASFAITAGVATAAL